MCTLTNGHSQFVMLHLDCVNLLFSLIQLNEFEKNKIVKWNEMSTQSIKSLNYKSVSEINSAYSANPKDWENGQNCHSLTKNEKGVIKKVLFYSKFLLEQNEVALYTLLCIVQHCLILTPLQNYKKRHAIWFNSRFRL